MWIMWDRAQSLLFPIWISNLLIFISFYVLFLSFIDKNFIFLLGYFDTQESVTVLSILFHCFVNLYASTTLSWLLWFPRILKSGSISGQTLFFFFKIAPNIWSLLHFPTNFRINLSISRKPGHQSWTFDVPHSISTVPTD